MSPESAALESRARDDAFNLLTGIGAARDARYVRRLVKYRGVDPVAVRAAVLAEAGNPMTPPPSVLIDDLTVAQIQPNSFMVQCPIWTVGGLSSWWMYVEVELPLSSREFVRRHVSRLVHRDDGRVIDTVPCPAADGSGWVDDAEFRPEQWPGEPDDPRIPRGVFVGPTYGILFMQFHDGVARVTDDVSDVRRLNAGLGAAMLIDTAFSALYADGIEAAYQRSGQPDFESAIIDACRRIGAAQYADVFTRVLATMPASARGSVEARSSYIDAICTDSEHRRWEAFDKDLLALDRSDDVIWEHLERYVETHQEEFFLPER